MKPENFAEPPDLSKLLPFLPAPSSSPFWGEVGKSLSWLRYLWTGPAPKVEVTLRTVYPDFQVSPKAIYDGIIEEIAGKEIPGIACGQAILHESGPFSPNRAYLRIKREWSEYFVCAAAVGTSFFISVRNIDHFPHTRWFHYLLVGLGIAILFFAGVAWYGLAGGVVVPMLSVTFVWSLFRYASFSRPNVFSDRIPEMPVLGAIYVRWFRPDTFFRQDLHAAFLTLVDGAIRKVVASIEPVAPIRPQSGTPEAPTPETSGSHK